MMERLKEIQAKILAWWNKFTSKQKTIIVGLSAVVIFTFAILIYIFSKPQYTTLYTSETTSEAASIIEVLEGAGIIYQVSNDGLLISVEESSLSVARLALGAAGYPADSMTIYDVVNGSFSTTESDKQKLLTAYLQTELEEDFMTFSAVKSAKVILNIADQDGTLISKAEESSAYIRLELSDTFTSDNAATMARAAATALGNATTANITIVDTNANLLFSGEEDYTTSGIANSMFELRNQAETLVASQVKKVLLGTNQYDMVEVASSLDIDFATYANTTQEYYAPDGRDEGMIDSESVTESENTSGSGGTPGTDSNDETTYVYESGSDTSSSSSSRDTDYLPNISIENKTIPAGVIDYTKSTVAITAISYNTIKESDVERQGLLDGTTWEDYQLENKDAVKLEVDTDFYSVVSNATNIPVDSITIIAYRENLFIDKESTPINYNTLLSIVMLVVIFVVLGFIVFRSMYQPRVAVVEEELSVENLLQSAPAREYDDIELESKSEIRKLVEKFIDEKPEAAANLLRNWLNEDWE